MKKFQLHAISERLKIACPMTEKQDQMYDFSHILDFCSQLQALIIEGSYEKLGTSNIVPNELHFDLVSFKNLVDLKILGVPMPCIRSVGKYTFNSNIHIVTIIGMCHLCLLCTFHHNDGSQGASVSV